MNSAHIYLLNDWTVEFQRNVHMYTNNLKLCRDGEAYQIFCEDTPFGFVGIWPYHLKATVTEATFHQLLAVLRKWVCLCDFQYRLYTSQDDYETNDTQA